MYGAPISLAHISGWLKAKLPAESDVDLNDEVDVVSSFNTDFDHGCEVVTVDIYADDRHCIIYPEGCYVSLKGNCTDTEAFPVSLEDVTRLGATWQKNEALVKVASTFPPGTIGKPDVLVGRVYTYGSKARPVNDSLPALCK